MCFFYAKVDFVRRKTRFLRPFFPYKDDTMMQKLKTPLLLLATLTSLASWPAHANDANDKAAQLNDPVIGAYLSLKSFFNKFPGFSREGMILPQSLLLDKVRAAVKADGWTVENLILKPEGGTLIVINAGLIDAEHRIHFRFLPVNWANRRVPMAFEVESSAISDHLLGKLLGTMAVNAMSVAVDTPVDVLAGQVPYVSVARNRQILFIKLDEVPSLAPILNTSLMGYKPFDYFGIGELKTVQDGVLIKLRSFDKK